MGRVWYKVVWCTNNQKNDPDLEQKRKSIKTNTQVTHILKLVVNVDEDVKVAIIKYAQWSKVYSEWKKKRQEISAEKQTIILKAWKFANWKI